ncbi:MAG: DUF4259 domain-containing protein [Bacteroidetes bacterium]|nr:DUF4259 domain-containing protein [Bacteroidota bacterium]
MGFWGIRNFENDYAWEWLEKVKQNPTEQFLLESILRVYQVREISDSQFIYQGLVAAELIAIKKGHFPKDFNEIQNVIPEIINKLTFIIEESFIWEVEKAILFCIGKEMEWYFKSDKEFIAVSGESPFSREMDDWIQYQLALIKRIKSP